MPRGDEVKASATTNPQDMDALPALTDPAQADLAAAAKPSVANQAQEERPAVRAPKTCRKHRAACTKDVCLCLTAGQQTGWFEFESRTRPKPGVRMLLPYLQGVDASQFRGFWEVTAPRP